MTRYARFGFGNMKQCLFIVMIFISEVGKAQIPTEIFAGHHKSSIDIMFFKFLKTRNGEDSRWLFFNRNRASVDYRMTSKTFLPQFGFTEAVSYNHQKLKGVALVAVVQVLNLGVYPKAGVQYSHLQKELTLFSWLVCETLNKPAVDFFVLFRYTPNLTENLKLFIQCETVNAFPTSSSKFSNASQRIRLGLKLKRWQFGAGADFNETGNKTLSNTHNIGGFLRHEF